MGDAEEPVFDKEREGENTDPPFVELDEELTTLKIAPSDAQLIGKSYAIYVNGNVNVNSTMQGPVNAHNDEFFSVTIPVQIIMNQAPDIPSLQSVILVYPIG